MQDPTHELKQVISSIVEPSSASIILDNIDKYFTLNSSIINPLVNSPKSTGREGLKAIYQTLKVITFNNKMEYHTVAFDNITVNKGIERRVTLLDVTEHLRVRFVPFNPDLHLRFLVRVQMIKVNGLWLIEQQEDSYPSDFGRSGWDRSGGILALPALVLTTASNSIKAAIGLGALIVGSVAAKTGIID